MNDIFSEQKEKLIAIQHEINLLRQQVNYLLRNEKPLGLLDLDVLMNRTHTLYDMLCAIQVNDSTDEEEFDLDAEALAGLFGDLSQEETQEEPQEEIQEEPQEEEAEELQEELEEKTEELPEADEEPIEEETAEEEVAEEMVPVEEVAEETTIEVAQQEETEDSHEAVVVEEEAPAEEEVIDKEVAPAEEEVPNSDEFGLFFRFEDEVEDEPVEEPQPEPQPFVFEDRPVVTDDGKVVHFVEEIPEEDIPARDLVNGDELLRENPFDMPRMEDGSEEELGFELTQSESLGESLMHEDHSLAARLQQNPVRDLKSAIGINDKFLFVNELFGGSMEKYNKSIENLNDLKTLNGAMIYLNELKVELQWNSSNEAYQKLTELVRRKFD